jgi:biopolymer transport protein ExbD
MFFIVCVNFKSQDFNNKDVLLPVAQSARPLEVSGSDPLYLNMNDRGELLVTGQEPLRTKSEMGQYLKQEYARAERSAKEKGSSKIKTVVIIRAHKSVDYEPVYDLLRLCKDSGFTKLQLRAVQKSTT